MSKRIGLFGGTFDPVHLGHLQLAERVFVQCALDKVLFIPTATPPHKKQKSITDFSHRVRMIQLALKNSENYDVTSLEEYLPGPNFTINTLKYLKKKSQGDEELFFLTGVDAFLEIETWMNHLEVLSSIHFIVLQRAGYDSDSLDCFVRNLGYLPENNHWENALSGKKMYFLEDKVIDISSSAVKYKIKNKLSLEGFLPDDVVRYIQENNLYRV